jgi:undecaprenyl-diphosphatase
MSMPISYTETQSQFKWQSRGDGDGQYSAVVRRVVFVTNPIGVRHLGLLQRRCQEAAHAHGWDPWFVTSEPGHGGPRLPDEFVSYAGSAAEKLVFAVGGDGTVGACAQHLAHTGTPLAIVPRGTANLFAAALGVPRDLGRALGAGFGRYEKPVDLAVANGTMFVAMAGIGVDAAVVEGTPQLLKRHLGWLGYAVAALPHLAAGPYEMIIKLDGAEPFVRRARAVVVGNVGILPGGFTILPGACLDDGLLDVGVLSAGGVLGWAAVAHRAIVGTSLPGVARTGGAYMDGPSPRPEQVEHYRAEHVEVTAARALWREADGEVLSQGRALSVGVQRLALRVRLPDPSGDR